MEIRIAPLSKFGYSDSGLEKCVITEKVDFIPLLTPKRHNAVQEKIAVNKVNNTFKIRNYIFDLGQNMVEFPELKCQC